MMLRFLLVALMACGTTSEPQVKQVAVAPIRLASLMKETTLHGVTEARSEANVSFTLAGRVTEINVRIGDDVQEGQALAELDSSGHENARMGSKASLAELQARYHQVRRDRERAEKLKAQGAMTQSELEQLITAERAVLSGIQAASAQVSETERQVGETSLVAPFAGTISDIYIETGETIDAGTAVLTIAGDTGVEVRVDVPEGLILQIELGSLVAVDLPLVGLEGLDGRVASVGRAATGMGRLFPVVVEIPSRSGIAPGMTAEVSFRTAAEPAMAVPVQAVSNPAGNRSFVRVVRDGVVSRITVETLELKDQLVTIKGELEPGDMVVTGGNLAVSDGEKVDAVPDQTTPRADEQPVADAQDDP